MQISLKFIEQALHRHNHHIYAELNNLNNPFFETLRLFSRHTAPSPSTLYLALSPSAEAEAARALTGVKNCGLICYSGTSIPSGIPVLVFMESAAPEIIFEQVSSIFLCFQKWSNKVSQYVLEKRPLSDIFSLLSEVTPNPWWLADTSFRIPVISQNKDFEDMSIIWKNQYTAKHLSIDVILDLAESGELDLINSKKNAFIPNTQVFNIPYVTKNLYSSRGLIAHFFIIGLYNKLGTYEVEIAEFFGNLISSLLKGDNEYLPTRGRYYDNYFIDLLENKIESEDDTALIQKVFASLEWTMEQQYMILIFSSRKHNETASIVNNLQLNVLESSYPCRAFIYQEKIVVILNVSLTSYFSDDNCCDSLLCEIQKTSSNFGSFISYSEPFYIHEGLDEVPRYYKQAKAALAWGIRNNLVICGYKEVAINELCDKLTSQHMEWIFLHPAIDILFTYDMENGTDLCKSLLYYLIYEQNTVRTAKALYIHRNSLIYRIDKIRELTDLDLNDVHNRIRIILSLIHIGYLLPKQIV